MERSLAPPLPTVGRTDSQSSYSRSSIYLREWHLCRYVLVALSVVIIISMVIGFIFVAHYYFHILGGQGFLKARGLVPDLRGDEKLQSCLPLRSMARPTDGMHGFDYSGVKRSPSILPFYPCGDQQNSCEAYYRAVSPAAIAFMIALKLTFPDQNICCPMGMSCHSTPYTNSGTFCCNSTASESECQASQSQPPKCPALTFECTAVVGGGCCSNGTACSENGCIEFDGSGTPAPITSTYVTTIIHTAASKAIGPSPSGQLAEAGTNLMVTTITTTVTMVIGGASKNLSRPSINSSTNFTCLHSHSNSYSIQTRGGGAKSRGGVFVENWMACVAHSLFTLRNISVHCARHDVPVGEILKNTTKE